MQLILLIEDDYMTGAGIKRRLENAGFQVCWVTSLGEATQQWMDVIGQGGTFVLVLSDTELGDELSTAWHAQHAAMLSKKNIPFVAMSATWGRLPDAAEYYDQRGIRRLVKPLQKQELLDAIQEALAPQKQG